jgi:hypothetical protein
MYTQKANHVEDLISALAWSGEGIFGGDRQIIDSFDTQISRGVAYTTKQGALALKLCQKYRSTLVRQFGATVDSIIENETFASPLRTLVTSNKAITVVKQPSKYIKVTFPFDTKLVEKIREFKKENVDDWSEWNMEEKHWMFGLTEGNIMWVGNNLLPNGFSADEQFLEFYEKIQEILVDMENYAPSLVYDNGQLVFKNVHESVPQPSTDNTLDALLLAKRYGIEVWDDFCDNFLKSDNLTGITREFLRKDFSDELKFQAVHHKLKEFNQLLNADHSVMIVIPPENELAHLKKWHNHIISLGYTNSDITVMFRVDNVVNRAFNEYIKDNNLNSPIHKDMKFVFVSRRIKKPLVQSGINFGLAISCDPLGSHINTKRIINDKYNTIVYVDNGMPENEEL